MLNSLKYSNCKIVIGGDFNIYFNLRNNTADNTMDAFRSYGFNSVVDFCTRGKYRIDNVFVSRNTVRHQTFPIPFDSDHAGMVLQLTIERKSSDDHVRSHRIVRPFTCLGKVNFFNCLMSIDWALLEIMNDVNSKFAYF